MADSSFIVGSRVAFLDDALSWTLGKIIRIDKAGKKTTYVCSADTEKGEFSVNSHFKLYHARDELFAEEPNDLLMLTELHEATLLHCLKTRYLKDIVYTNIGTLIVAVNPFKRIAKYQAENTIKDYLSEGPVIQTQLPHAWSVAHQTYHELVNDRENQTILISGESGAGKTVAAKIMVEYLTAVSCQRATEAIKHATELVGVKVQAASPILESFGNAKTVRNDNSSRFGKFMKVQFDTDGFLIGAHTTKYLLEKSRIITAAKNERIYHVFYQICAHSDREKYKLGPAEQYTTCNAGKCLSIDGVDDNEDQSSCIQAMEACGITDEEKDSVWRAVAGILMLQSTSISERTDAQNNQMAELNAENKQRLAAACEQFGVNAAVMEKEMTSTTSKTFTRALSKAKSIDVRDSVSKVLYDSMFQWLVDKINITTDRGADTSNWLGLLDIFGFEDFEHNSFEQLCINLANESLQGHYNNYIFVEDMKECQREGIDTTGVTFADNSACLDLLSGKLSVFSMLDVECSLPGGTDQQFISKLHDAFGGTPGANGKRAHEFYRRQLSSPNTFTIRHYAGDVTYDVSAWLEKNKEPLKNEMRTLMRNSSNTLIKTLIPAPQDSTKGSQQMTVSRFFCDQVKELISLINGTNPHWIRCVKPHPSKKPGSWSPKEVMNQLRCAGVIETVRVRKAGYPIRFPHTMFRDRYCAVLGSEGLLSRGDAGAAKPIAGKILEKLGLGKEVAQMGNTKTFLRQEAFLRLNAAKDSAVLQYVVKLQCAARGQKARSDCFWMFVKKHKSRIEAEKKEAERRQVEQKRVAEEEQQRAKQEAEELFRVEEEARSKEELQREMERARDEWFADERIYQEHETMIELDKKRKEIEDFDEKWVHVQLRKQRRAHNMMQSFEFEKKVEEMRKAEEHRKKRVQLEKRKEYDLKKEQSKKKREELRKVEEEKRRERLKRESIQRVSTREVEKNAEERFLREVEKKQKAKEKVGVDSRAHFERACKLFDAKHDWEVNREQYLANDHYNRLRQERVMLNKQFLADHDLYQNPPNPLLTPDPTAPCGVPSVLSQHQKALEVAYQHKIEHQYDILRGAGVDPIEELQLVRQKRLAELRVQRRLARHGAASSGKR
ncbi:Myosin-6 [Diplonema papillatum]|nr:Myosin-6 [Diplonema papillatum]